jgi:hypothetical protein
MVETQFIDFTGGITICDADVAAQEACRWHALRPDEYLQFLLTPTKDREPSRETPPFHEPFRL